MGTITYNLRVLSHSLLPLLSVLCVMHWRVVVLFMTAAVVVGVRGQVQLTCNDTVTICSALETCCCPVPLNLCSCCVTGAQLCNNGVCELPSVSSTPTAPPTRTPSPSASVSPSVSPSPRCPSPSPVGVGYRVVDCGRVEIVINSTSSDSVLVVEPGVVVNGDVELISAVVIASNANSTTGVNVIGADSTVFINNTQVIITGPPPVHGTFVPLFTVESGNITVGNNVTVQFEGSDEPEPDGCSRRSADTAQRANTLGVLFTVDSSGCSQKGSGSSLSNGEIVGIVVGVTCCAAICFVLCGVLMMAYFMRHCACLTRMRERRNSDEVVATQSLTAARQST